MTLSAYVTEYSSDAGNSWDCGELHWTLQSAVDEGRGRGECCTWRVRRLRLSDAGEVKGEAVFRALTQLLEIQKAGA